MTNKIFLILAIAIISLTASCRTGKNIAYFQNADTLKSLENTDYALKLIPSDQLKIMISSLIPEATDIFSQTAANYTTTDGSQVSNQSTTISEKYSLYIIDKNGEIEMPIIGKLKLAGLSTLEATDLIKQRLSEHVQDPIVRVELANFRVNVLGEVTTPGAKTVKTERYSIFDAIADAGDLTIYGKRENVMLIREENGTRTFHRIDLTDANIVNSPYFYLKQNDVLYIEPDKVRVANSEYNTNNSFKISVVSTVVSAISVIASLVIALAINK